MRGKFSEKTIAVERQMNLKRRFFVALPKKKTGFKHK